MFDAAAEHYGMATIALACHAVEQGEGKTNFNMLLDLLRQAFLSLGIFIFIAFGLGSWGSKKKIVRLRFSYRVACYLSGQ